MGNNRMLGRLMYCMTFLSIILLFWVLSPDPSLGTPASPTEKPKTTSSFTDLDSADGNFVYIEYITKRGLIKGFPDGTFRPKEGMTRAQAAVVIAKAAGLETPAVDATPFNDLEASHWAAPFITAAARAGYIAGFPDGSFRADEQLTRAQGITLIMNLCTQPERAALPQLQDVSPDHWAAPAIATALALEMVGRSSDGSKVYPDAIMTRGSMARALSILLTRDPGLYSTPLNGTLCEIKGAVTLTRSGKTWSVSQDTVIMEGDTIQTGSNGQARITYPDGSGTLLGKNTQVTVKTAQGRNYTKKDGSPGTAVDYLKLDLQKGMLLGALATREQSNAEETAGWYKNRVAALDSFNYLAANPTSNLKWYQTAQSKKVKVEVDMPWGVAAIRGTFIMVTINPDGSCRVSCLTGNAEVTGNSGSPVAIGGGQSTGIGSEGGPASSPSGMSEEDKRQFAQSDIQAWVVDTALQIDLNQEVKPVTIIVGIPDPESSQIEENAQPTQEQLIAAVVEAIVNALQNSGIELQPGVRENLVQELTDLGLPTPDIPEPTATKSPSRGGSDDDRGGNTGASLSQLSVSAGTLSPAFAPSVTNYSVTVDNAVTSITVAAVAASSSARITINDTEFTGNTASEAIELQEGANTVVIKVIAGNITTTYTLTINRESSEPAVSYGAITEVDLNEGIIYGTTNGRGDVVTGGGVFIKNLTLDKWIMPLYDLEGNYAGKKYVHNRSDACLLGFMPESTTDDLLEWELDLSGLKLPNSYDYRLYLRVNLLNQGVQEDQDIVEASTDPLTNVDSAQSEISWDDEPYYNKIWIELIIRDQNGEPIKDLEADQFLAVINGKPVSMAQAPFFGFEIPLLDGVIPGDEYWVNLAGSGSQVISSLKVGGVEILDELVTIDFGESAVVEGYVYVKDSSGEEKPLSGVEVSAALDYEYPQEAVSTAITDDEGKYSLNVPFNNWYRIKYDWPGYSAPYQQVYLEGSGTQEMDEVIMLRDDTRPTAVLSFPCDYGILLRAVDGPLSDESWYSINNLIRDNPDYWNSDQDYRDDLFIEYISLDGTEMLLTNWYVELFIEPAKLERDFIIPTWLLTDRAGNRALAPITVSKQYYGWLEIGDLAGICGDSPVSNLSLAVDYGYDYDEETYVIPYVAYCDETGQVTVRSYQYDDEVEDWNWVEIGNPQFTASEIRLAVIDGTPYLAYVDKEDSKVNIRIYDYDIWDEFSDTGTGSQAEKLQLLFTDYQCYPVAVFADNVSGYVYGAAREYDWEGWRPLLLDSDEEECYFYQGEPIQGLAAASLVFEYGDGGYDLCYCIAYISSKELFVANNEAEYVEEPEPGYSRWTIVGGTSVASKVNPAGGVSLGIYRACHLVAYLDDNGIRVKHLNIDGENMTWSDLASPGVDSACGPVRLFVYRSIPYLCFADENSRLTLMKFNGFEWETMESIMPAPEIDPAEVELVVDDYGVPYVLYRDSAGKAHVVQYMAAGSDNVNIESTSVAVDVYYSVYDEDIVVVKEVVDVPAVKTVLDLLNAIKAEDDSRQTYRVLDGYGNEMFLHDSIDWDSYLEVTAENGRNYKSYRITPLAN